MNRIPIPRRSIEDVFRLIGSGQFQQAIIIKASDQRLIFILRIDPFQLALDRLDVIIFGHSLNFFTQPFASQTQMYLEHLADIHT